MGDVAPFDQDFRRRLGQFGHRLVDCGQRRPDRAGQRGIVEPGDGQLAGQLDIAIMRNREDPGGHIVVRGEDRGRRLGQVKQAACPAHTGIEIEFAIADQDRIIGDPGPVERAAITSQAILRALVVGVTLDEADPAVAGIDQVGRHVIGRLGIVHEHRTGQRVIGAGRDPHERDVHRLQRAQHRLAIGHRRGQDDPVDLGFGDQPADLVADIGIGDVDRLGQQADTLGAADVPAAGLNLEHVVGAVIVVDQRNLVAFRARENPRGNRGPEFQRLHRLLDPGLRIGRDIGMAIEHAADGLHRHPGAGGHIADVRPFAHKLRSPAKSSA